MRVFNRDIALQKMRHFRQHFYGYRFSRQLRKENSRNRAFDVMFGTDTSAEVPLVDVGVSPTQAADGHMTYRAIWEPEFHRVIGALPINFEETAFVDYGAGKGKAMLMATEYPFRRIIGIEYASQLHRISVENWEIYRRSRPSSQIVEHVFGDAAEFEPPTGPLVCYLFNPFGATTTRNVLQNLYRSYLSAPRDIFVVYMNLRTVRERDDVFSTLIGFRCVKKDRTAVVYKIGPSEGLRAGAGNRPQA